MSPIWKNSALSHLHREVTLLPRYFSTFQRHHYRSLNDTSCTFPENLHTLPLFFPFCLTFPLRNDHSRAQRISAAWHFSSFTQLHTEITPQPASCTPLAFHRLAHPWLFLRRQLLHTLVASLTVLFFPFSVSVVLCLLVYHVFFACQFSRNYPRQFFRGGTFLYSGFNFSHYDLPFPTHYCIPYVRSGLYQLVIRVKGFCVSAHVLDSHCIRFCRSAWSHALRESSCV